MFGGALRQAVLQFKYEGVSAMAIELAPLLEKHLAAHPLSFDLIVPVPLFRDRARERGYNQAALLAAHLSRAITVLVRPEALRRVWDRGPLSMRSLPGVIDSP